MPDLTKIKLLVLDVDGVLTDGAINIDSRGVESKRFNVQDGHGIKLWQRCGLETAIISGRTSAVVEFRAKELEIKYVRQGCKEKLPPFEELLKLIGFTAEQTACVGDDITDIPLVKRAGFGVAVANAVAELKSCADYVASRPGGCGAVREIIEYILKNTGRWDELMKKYLI